MSVISEEINHQKMIRNTYFPIRHVVIRARFWWQYDQNKVLRPERFRWL
jgi:hypothetical protein